MGKWKKELVKALANHYRFAAMLTWVGLLDSEQKGRLDDFLEHVDNPAHVHEHTRIDKDTLQGYYLQSFHAGTIPERFVIIGLHEPGKPNSRWGIEQFCSSLIFKKRRDYTKADVSAPFYQVVEANELKHVKFPII